MSLLPLLRRLQPQLRVNSINRNRRRPQSQMLRTKPIHPTVEHCRCLTLLPLRWYVIYRFSGQFNTVIHSRGLFPVVGHFCLLSIDLFPLRMRYSFSNACIVCRTMFTRIRFFISRPWWYFINLYDFSECRTLRFLALSVTRCDRWNGEESLFQLHKVLRWIVFSVSLLGLYWFLLNFRDYFRLSWKTVITQHHLFLYGQWNHGQHLLPPVLGIRTPTKVIQRRNLF